MSNFIIRGSEHNDTFIPLSNTDNNLTSGMDFNNKDDLSAEKIKLKLSSNNSGGTLGGITTGETVYFRVAIKPVSTISKEQMTSDWGGKVNTLKATGRHDPCVLPRAMPIVEGMAGIVLMDFALIQQARVNSMIRDDELGIDNELEDVI